MLLDSPDTEGTAELCLVECVKVCPHGCVAENCQADELCPHGYKIVQAYPTSDVYRTERLDECFQDMTDARYAVLTENSDIEMTACNNCVKMDFSNCDHKAHKKERSEKSKSLQTSPIKTMENAGILTKDGYMLIDRTPRLQKEALRLSEPTQSKKEASERATRFSDPTGSRKCKHSGMVSKDGYMLVDATPRQPQLKDGRRTPSHEIIGLPAVTNMRLNSESIEENYMEFNATDGYMKAVDQAKITNYTDEYALMCPELSNEKSVLCHAHNSKIIAEMSENDEGLAEACFSEACSSDSKPGKNKKHSFFKKDDYKNDKGKIPKVSSDHTISDESKKKYNFFQRRDDEGSRPKFAIGDMRASWREFTGKFTDNRKKKDRDDSS
ncbi:hypothetical protein O0L34_g27 [Tuta absoluta]|nr:hypothetical protein O0L34_g27 [Tuta absoluta]